MEKTKQARQLATPKVNANGSKNPTLSFRVRGDLYDRLRKNAQADGYSLSETIERRLLSSFNFEEQISLQDEIKTEMRSTIAALEDQVSMIKEKYKEFWRDETTRILGEAFTLIVAASQQKFGQNWRESGSVVAVVVAVMRDIMTKLGRPGAEFDTLSNRARVDEATSNIAKSIVETFAATMPPLPEIARPNQQSSLTGRARIVTTFRDKITGKVLETTTGPEFDRNDPKDRWQSGPEYRAAIERYRPRRDSIDIEISVMHVLADGGSAWDTISDDEPAVRLVGVAEAAAQFEAAHGLLHPSIGDTALFDETMGPDRSGDATPPDPVTPAAPAPTKRKARAKA